MSRAFSSLRRHLAAGLLLLFAGLALSAAAANAAPVAGSGLVAAMNTNAGAVRARLAEVIAAARDLPALLAVAGAWLGQEENRRVLATTALLASLVLAAGIVLEIFSRVLLRRAGLSGDAGPPAGAGRLARLFIRFTVDLFAIATFAIGSVGALLLLYDQDDAAFPLLLLVVAAVVALRLIAVASRALFAPRAAAARLLPLEDGAGARLYRHFMVLVGILVVFRLVHELASEVGEGMRGLIGLAMIWLFALALSWSLWRCRDLIAQYFSAGASAAGEAASIRSILGTRLHALAIGYVAVAAVAASLVRLATGRTVAAPILASFAIVVAIPLADWLVRAGARALVRVISPPAGAAGKEDAAAAARRVAYERVLVRNARVLLAVMALLTMAAVWSVDVGTMAERGLGARVAEALFDIVITLTLASALWGLVRTALRQGAVPADAVDAESGSLAAASRLQTLLPLFGNFILVAIVVIAGLVVLSSLGVNIAPLIAGAGVVGIALGFGAQTLVRDMLSGVFLLIEDAFRVGEYVDVGSAKGTVENISLRYLRLRHHLGPINTIPFGEIKTLTNFSRDWAIMKLELRVPYATDLEKVRKIVKKVGQELLSDPELGPHFLQPLKSQGVHRMDDSAFIVRVKFMARPGEQFVLRREVFRRIQQAFAAKGIEFAPRRVIVDAAGKEAAAAAALAGADNGSAAPGGTRTS